MEHAQAHANRQTVEAHAQDGLLVHYLGSIPPAAGGCVVEFAFTLPAVPPDTRTAVAITLLELDKEGRAFPGGCAPCSSPPTTAPGPWTSRRRGSVSSSPPSWT